jgi:hypothetical protein
LDKINNYQLPTTITLKQNDQTRSIINLDKADTLLYIDSLLPNTTYTFQAITQSSNQSITSNELSVTTMDTTSHNFTWQSWTFGEHSSSVLYDVAIIDPDNIWAVGEIYLNDSLGQPDPRPYGAIHWNGNTWTPIKVPYHDFGSTNRIPRPIKTILAFDEDSIYVTSSANLLKLEGEEWIEKAFFMKSIPFDGQVLKMWGTDGNNIYCVGRTGAIYHFKGSNWHKIYSGTDTNINGIWGIVDDNTGESFILATVSNVAASGDIELLQIEANGVKTFPWVQDRWVVSIWFNDIYKLFASGSGVHISNKYGEWIKQESLLPKFSESIIGQANNDVFVVGDFSLISHYNGQNWKVFDDTPSGRYIANAYKNGVMVAVGDMGSKAIVLKMKPL